MMNPAQILLVLLSALSLKGVHGQSTGSTAWTPSYGSCPGGFSLVRQAGAPGNQTLGSGEASYVSARKSEVLPNAWKAYLTNVQATNVSLPSYVSSILGGYSSGEAIPTLGIATSGGGYRAGIFGAGVLNSLDGRNSSSTAIGTGGLLQAATYLSGLSGGSWLVTSLAQADFPSIQDLLLGPTIPSTTENSFGGWLTQFGLFTPSGNSTEDTAYIETLIAEVRGKYDAGFAVTFNDVYARDLSRHFVNGTTASDFMSTSVSHGAGLMFSGIADVSTFVAYEQPFPIILADLISPNGNVSTLAPGISVPQSNPIIEFNVYETGSYDPTLAAFTPTEYLGTSNTTTCVTGYDQTIFLVGASSDYYTIYNTSTQAIMSSPIGYIIAALNESIPQADVELDVARFPNPFYDQTNGTFIDSGEKFLALTDGGNDGEPVPIQPLLVKARGVDTIFAIDGNADTTTNWAAGGSLISTQNRTALFPTAYSFPPVPTNTSEFIAQKLSTRPTFFGCNSSVDAPLLIYLANGGPPHNGEAPVTNISTSQLEPQQVQSIIDQTFIIATQGNPANANETSDSEWAACLACAVVDRARNRTGVERSGVCVSCFDRYCWDGSIVGLASSTSWNNAESVIAGLKQTLGMAAVILVLTALLADDSPLGLIH